MIITVLILLFLCIAAMIAGVTVARKRNPELATKNYMVRSVGGSLTATVIYAFVLFYVQTIVETVKLLYDGIEGGFPGAVMAMTVLLLILIGGSYIAAVFEKRIKLLFSLAGAVLLIGIVTSVVIAAVENNQLFSFIWPMIAMLSVFALFAAINILMDMRRKRQAVVLAVMDVIIISAAALLIVQFVSIGVSAYQSGLFDSYQLTDAVVILAPAVILLVVPPLMTVGSIIVHIISSFNRN